MSDKSGIEWTDSTWNPVVGCDKVSPGCDHCYAIRTAHRMQANPNEKIATAYAGTEANGEWTGRINLLGDRLDQPLRWRTPRKIFVNAQSDLFHKSVPDEFIARVWAVMANAPQHTFQILTKRPGRMRSLLDSDRFRDLFDTEWCAIPDWAPRLPNPDFVDIPHLNDGPLPNVWLGTSVEDQHWADIRVRVLLGTPAAVRFLSCEPLLGAIDLTQAITPNFAVSGWKNLSRLDWVIVGGESGPGARPMHMAWARSLRDQCTTAGVPFHFKQWGEWIPCGSLTADGINYDDPTAGFERVGKKAAGRELDGRTWDEYPQTVVPA